MLPGLNRKRYKHQGNGGNSFNLEAVPGRLSRGSWCQDLLEPSLSCWPQVWFLSFSSAWWTPLFTVGDFGCSECQLTSCAAQTTVLLLVLVHGGVSGWKHHMRCIHVEGRGASLKQGGWFSIFFFIISPGSPNKTSRKTPIHRRKQWVSSGLGEDQWAIFGQWSVWLPWIIFNGPHPQPPFFSHSLEHFLFLLL